MATLTLKNVPDDLHRRLKERAARNHRSLNREVIHALEEAIAPEAGDLSRRIRVLHDRLKREGIEATPESVRAAIEEGRA